ncbi:aspartyl protease [Limnoraphis robusta Tam1]|uniref:aspartyl protease n=1 Tax=Limnoraphis robusta TaxID=1118279 RepID=UPI002B21E610|nr:aspartyl protease [Limnoraphis robusta]MEA5495830.1 aspartyl protease [Limnoraphis robusta BA-68 BA1]MEA5542184.1 aspartyl protease [Limnoraphis robusta Tam1]
MIQGRFGEEDELIFEIDLITGDGEILSVDVLLDTGFTTGYLAIDKQDIDALGWSKIQSNIRIKTAQGVGKFDIYEGQVVIDGQEFVVPVHVGRDLPETLIGVKWLKLMRLNVDYQQGILTMEYIE